MPIYPIGEPADTSSTGQTAQSNFSTVRPEERIFETEPWLVRNAPVAGQFLGSTAGGVLGGGGGTFLGAGAGAPAGGVGAIPGAVLGLLTGAKLGRETGAAFGRSAGQGIRDIYHAVRGDQFAPTSVGEEASRLGGAALSGAGSELLYGRGVPLLVEKAARSGLMLSGLSWPATKTALDEGIAVMKGNVVRGSGKVAEALGGARANVGRVMSRLAGESASTAEQRAGSPTLARSGFEMLKAKMNDASVYVGGLIKRIDESGAKVNIGDLVRKAQQQTLADAPKDTPVRNAQALSGYIEDYLKEPTFGSPQLSPGVASAWPYAPEGSRVISNAAAHELFQAQNMRGSSAFEAAKQGGNPAAGDLYSEFHKNLAKLIRDELVKNGGPKMGRMLDEAIARQAALIKLRDELSGGAIEQGVERKFVRPTANQGLRTIMSSVTSAGGGYGMATHNPLAIGAGVAGLGASYPPVSSNIALMLGSPVGRTMLGRYLAATNVPDVYGEQGNQ